MCVRVQMMATKQDEKTNNFIKLKYAGIEKWNEYDVDIASEINESDDEFDDVLLNI